MFYHYYKIQQRFARMKNALIDWTSVARELIQDVSRSCIPYVNHPIWTPSCDFAYIRWPATLQQVLLKIVLVALSKKDSMNSQMRSVLVFSWFVFLLLSTSNALSVLSGLADIIYDPSVVQWRSKTAYILVPFQNHEVLAIRMHIPQKISLSWDPDATTDPTGLNFIFVYRTLISAVFHLAQVLEDHYMGQTDSIAFNLSNLILLSWPHLEPFVPVTSTLQCPLRYEPDG